MAESIKTTIEWIPPGGSPLAVVRDELIRLYQSTYSTAEYFDAFHQRRVEDCWILAMRRGDALKHLLMLSADGKSIVLLNDMITLEASDLSLLSRAVFSHFTSANRLEVNRVRLRGAMSFAAGERGFRVQRINDAVLNLPSTREGYMQLLGAQTRKHVAYYHNRMRKTFDGFHVAFADAAAVTSDHVARVVEMNHARLASKGGHSSIDKDYEERLMKIARSYGFLCLCLVKEKAVAGSICTKAGKDAYLHVIAHDVDFDKFNAGQLCLVNTINRLIETGFARFHMLWGQSEYKYRFGAADEYLDFFNIYRSGMHRAQGLAGVALKKGLGVVEGGARRIMRKLARRKAARRT